MYICVVCIEHEFVFTIITCWDCHFISRGCVLNPDHLCIFIPAWLYDHITRPLTYKKVLGCTKTLLAKMQIHVLCANCCFHVENFDCHLTQDFLIYMITKMPLKYCTLYIIACIFDCAWQGYLMQLSEIICRTSRDLSEVNSNCCTMSSCLQSRFGKDKALWNHKKPTACLHYYCGLLRFSKAPTADIGWASNYYLHVY